MEALIHLCPACRVIVTFRFNPSVYSRSTWLLRSSSIFSFGSAAPSGPIFFSEVLVPLPSFSILWYSSHPGPLFSVCGWLGPTSASLTRLLRRCQRHENSVAREGERRGQEAPLGARRAFEIPSPFAYRSSSSSPPFSSSPIKKRAQGWEGELPRGPSDRPFAQ